MSFWRQKTMKNKLAAAPYLVWMAIFIIVPLGIVLYFAFTDSVTGQFTFANIANISSILPVFLKSIWLALIASAVCLLIGYPVAYCIAKASEKAQRFLILLVMLPMCMSFLLRTLSLVSLLGDTGIINNFLSALGIGPLPLIRHDGAVILGMVYNYLPYMILPLYTVIIKINPLLIEAAQDLGCDSSTVFRKVILPLSTPGIISGITMVFVPAISTFYISKKLGGTNLSLIGDIIESQVSRAYNPNFGAALSLVLMILVFICMGIMSRFSYEDDESMVTL